MRSEAGNPNPENIAFSLLILEFLLFGAEASEAGNPNPENIAFSLLILEFLLFGASRSEK